MGDIIDILYVLQVLSPIDWNEYFSTSWREDVCVCVWVHTCLVWKPSLRNLYTRFFKSFLRNINIPCEWISYISLGLIGIFVCVTSKHRLSVRKTEARFVVGFVWFKKLNQLILFSLATLQLQRLQTYLSFSWLKRLFLSFCFFS